MSIWRKMHEYQQMRRLQSYTRTTIQGQDSNEPCDRIVVSYHDKPSIEYIYIGIQTTTKTAVFTPIHNPGIGIELDTGKGINHPTIRIVEVPDILTRPCKSHELSSRVYNLSAPYERGYEELLLLHKGYHDTPANQPYQIQEIYFPVLDGGASEHVRIERARKTEALAFDLILGQPKGIPVITTLRPSLYAYPFTPQHVCELCLEHHRIFMLEAMGHRFVLTYLERHTQWSIFPVMLTPPYKTGRDP